MKEILTNSLLALAVALAVIGCAGGVEKLKVTGQGYQLDAQGVTVNVLTNGVPSSPVETNR